MQPAPEQKRYFLDLGAYRDLSQVDRIQQQLADIGLALIKGSLMLEGQLVTHLRSGPYPGQKEATEALARLTNTTTLQARLVTN